MNKTIKSKVITIIMHRTYLTIRLNKMAVQIAKEKASSKASSKKSKFEFWWFVYYIFTSLNRFEEKKFMTSSWLVVSLMLMLNLT